MTRRQTPDFITRYVVTYVNRDGMRQLAHAQQGRHTYATADEADAWIRAALANNSRETLESVYGGAAGVASLAVRPCACWPGHFDPVGIYFDD